MPMSAGSLGTAALAARMAGVRAWWSDQEEPGRQSFDARLRIDLQRQQRQRVGLGCAAGNGNTDFDLHGQTPRARQASFSSQRTRPQINSQVSVCTSAHPPFAGCAATSAASRCLNSDRLRVRELRFRKFTQFKACLS